MKKTTFLIVLATLCLKFYLKAQQITTIRGQVTTFEDDRPLPGASIKIKNATTATQSDKNGQFTINAPVGTGTLVVSYTGYQTQELNFSVNNLSNLIVRLKEATDDLDEIQIIGYGQTTKRLNTGSVSSINAKQIEQQPVTNVISALSGRMPGVFVQATNGLPGGNINIQIRGKGSISAGTNPLYIIDGVPFESNLITANNNIAANSIVGAINPLNSINPSDIENISVLKDADATAIYGSRGSNGVILITTKSSKSGNTKTTVSLSRGVNSVSSLPKLTGIEEYLQIRREAYANAKLIPTVTDAPDLLVWDQQQNTNWAEYLFGNTAVANNIQSSVNGGDDQNNFNFSANYHQEGNVISKRANYVRGGLSFRFRHQPRNSKFMMQLSTSIVLDDNKSPNLLNAVNGLYLPPNFPLQDANGDYTPRSGNPLREMNASLNAKTDNLITNIIVGYSLTESLKIKLSAGYNKINIKQVQLFPTNSLPTGVINYAHYGQNANESYIFEPQLDYHKIIGKGRLDVLAGGGYQQKTGTSQFLKGSNYSNEGLLENISSATTIDVRSNSNSNYKFLSGFGRITYTYAERYVVNGTIRRDGSSRFGIGNRYGNFGSIAAAWIFSEESWFKNKLPLLSFGKLRSSIGTTGNDQIPDYQYLSTYGTTSTVYQGIATLNPARIQNDDFHWETTTKIELAAELGFFSNRLLFNVNYYQSRSKDQLVQYLLPGITGFNFYQANLPARVENRGWEFELNTVNISKKELKWSTNFNFTRSRNKLLSFENFERSSYAQTLAIGYDISRIKGANFLGVDPETGNAMYGDAEGKATNNPFFNYSIGKRTPDFFGGLGNTLAYKRLTLDVFLQFAKQKSVGSISSQPGFITNYFVFMVNRWQKSGDVTDVPKASMIGDYNYSISTANYFDASYIRVKNITLNYAFAPKLVNKIKVQKLNLYMRAQNLLTFWNRDVPLLDPETGAFLATQPNVPPGKAIVFGIDLTL